MADVGGLNDSLYIIAQVILLPFTSFYNASFLTRTIFRYKKKVSGEENYANKTDRESITKAKSLQKTVKIAHMSWLRFCLCRYSEQRQMHRKALFQAQSKLDKEMDLKKFITRQRLQTTAFLALLTGKQSFFIDKLSQMVIRESFDSQETSSDEELSDWGREDSRYAQKLAKSKDIVD